MSVRQNVSRTNPCPICGKPDMCFSSMRDDDLLLHVCGRVHQDMVSGTNGRDYKRIGKPSENGINSYATYVDVEEDFQKREENRKNWCIAHGKRFVPKPGSLLTGQEYAKESVPWNYDPGIVSPLSHQQLDACLRPWLEKYLILSEYHKQKLMKEWKSRPEMANQIFTTWPIRTLPPEDQERRKYARYWNRYTGGKTREELISDLMETATRQGLSLKGIPGFYQADDGNWKIHSQAGIVYPIFDPQGYLYRIRIGVDKPAVQGSFRGETGRFHFYGDAWYFSRDNKPFGEKSILV